MSAKKQTSPRISSAASGPPKLATDAELRGLFVRIRSLAKQPRKSTWSPCSNCDCSDCMRFRAIGKIATMAIDSNRLRDAKPKRRSAT